MKWLTRAWYLFLLDGKPDLRTILCRARGHAGPIFYRVYGDEPDWHCKNCGEDLG